MGIAAPPIRFRAGVSRSKVVGKVRVERDAGVYGAGMIHDVSMITVGEALGHEMWCDHAFLAQVVEAVQHAYRGIKARFTHPGLSNDGVGTKLGKFFNARLEGDQVIADLHFQQAAHETPDGDLANYVMTLAEETPEDFGLSIVFDHDTEASEEHAAHHSEPGQSFESPDEGNKENYYHARLHKLYAADVVDSPAANPGGLFKAGQEAAVEADQLLEFALGISDVKPAQSLFNVDGDRAKQFVARFLSRHGLTLIKEVEMSEDVTQVETPEVQAEGLTREDFNAELTRYVEAFGKERGSDWFIQGVEFADAQALCIEELNAELAAAKEEAAELRQRIESIALGEEDSGVVTPVEEETVNPYKGFAGKINIK